MWLLAVLPFLPDCLWRDSCSAENTKYRLITLYLLKGRSVHLSSWCRVPPVMELYLCLSCSNLSVLPYFSGLSEKFIEVAEIIRFCNNPVSLPWYLWCPLLAPAIYEFIRVNNTTCSEVRTKYFQLLPPLHVDIHIN